MLNAEVCFSSVFFLMTTGELKSSNVAIAALAIDSDHGVIQVKDALVDTGGSKNLASRHLLKNIKLVKFYEMSQSEWSQSTVYHRTTTIKVNYTQRTKTELRTRKANNGT